MNGRRGALAPPRAVWQIGKSVETIRRIRTINNQLKEYKKHCNDVYVYYPEEIDTVRELKQHAAKNIEFLLNEIMHL